ncbi:uncharacterized protein PAC_18975 [Phialocephala subalpina]|uniref:Zn(2)-C6 fungal-type domain-containing protein n=1 Tax=Phialocephala subalpina TaxID=576137 RepID=A0A1L7XVJ3_9HELO|nr:uncharacterized protein PAC_18975 [Phialocephala subalpina]
MPPSTDSPSSNPPSLSSHSPPNPSSNSTKKRNRSQLSCTNCRHAKLKCDRTSPCSQCIKKGRKEQCVFPQPVQRRKPAVSMQNRLRHLESLVKGAMDGKSGNRNLGVPSPAGSMEIGNQVGDVNTGEGVTEVSSGNVLDDGNETRYVGATHWAAILENIEEVKSYFNEEIEEQEDEYSPAAALSFDVESPATRLDLVNALPSRLVVDRLVSRYFNSNSPALHIIHGPTFQKEYQQFWAHQNETPLAWLALLYSAMVIATFSALGAGEAYVDDRGPPIEMIRSYRQCCVQALVLSHYTRPGPYTLEALMIYMEGEFLLSRVDQVHGYLLVGNAIRLAMRMGLHRDSSKVGGGLTPFQAEMRRRSWQHLRQIDLLWSFHIGLPDMMHSIESDTDYPRNLRDDDLDEKMTELPPSRPETELTPVTYMICKSRMCDVVFKIAALANLLTLPAYDEVIRLDAQLIEAHSKVPHFFRLPDSGFCITDPPPQIVKRITIELMLQKSRCMLHRKYLVKEKEDPRFAYSKDAGLDASLKLLRVQALAHEAALPGGLLARDRWFLSALSMHDFLLAAMIVYLSVIRNIGTHTNSEVNNGFTAEQQSTVAALEESYRIWTQSANPTPEAKRAGAVLKIMLKKVNLALGRLSNDVNGMPQETLEKCNDYTSNLLSSHLVSHLSINGNPANAYGHPSTSILPLSNALPVMSTSDTSPPSDNSGNDMLFDVDLSSIPLHDFGEMAAMPNDFNWELFDNQFHPQPSNEQVWPDFTQDFAAMNDEYLNYDLN